MLNNKTHVKINKTGTGSKIINYNKRIESKSNKFLDMTSNIIRRLTFSNH